LKLVIIQEKMIRTDKAYSWVILIQGF
jgi:hypothetical protein